MEHSVVTLMYFYSFHAPLEPLQVLMEIQSKKTHMCALDLCGCHMALGIWEALAAGMERMHNVFWKAQHHSLHLAQFQFTYSPSLPLRHSDDPDYPGLGLLHV